MGNLSIDINRQGFAISLIDGLYLIESIEEFLKSCENVTYAWFFHMHVENLKNFYRELREITHIDFMTCIDIHKAVMNLEREVFARALISFLRYKAEEFE